MYGVKKESNHLVGLLKKPFSKQILKRVSESAREEPCWLRFDECTDQGVVFAHYRSLRLGAGIGKKSGIWGCPACFFCHGEADRRSRIFEYDFVRARHAEATLAYMHHLYTQNVIDIK